MERKDKCGQCMFRIIGRSYRCNYAILTRHTRKAEPPEKCTYFRAGEPLETPREAQRLLERMEKPPTETEPPKVKRGKPDWGRAESLYKQGVNDSVIAGEIGVTSAAVCGWRKRSGLPANAAPGWKRTSNRIEQSKDDFEKTGEETKNDA